MTDALLDTSVLVSAFLFPDSVPGRLLKLADAGRYALHFSLPILDELNAVLRRDRLRRAYRFTDADVAAWLADLHETGFLLREPLPDIGRVCRDPDDDHVIAAALAAGAGWIVTGDKDLLELGQYDGVRMVTTRDFIGMVSKAGS